MLQYRAFIKDCLDITGMAIANEVCVSFELEEDLLSDASSSFVLLNIPTNIKEGDILGLVDPYGTIMYLGVIESFETEIRTNQILSIFDDEWRWHDSDHTTIERKIRDIIETDFVNSSDTLLAQKFPFEVVTTTSTTGTFEQHTVTKKEGETEVTVPDKTYVTNFKDFLIELYKTWGVIVDVQIPFEAGTPQIVIGKNTQGSIKIGNNALMVRNMTPTTEIFETNKLVIYDEDGSNLRGTFYGTTDGITDDSTDPLRLPVIKTSFVFNTEESLDDLKYQTLQEEMLNHKVEFDLLIDNQLYNFEQWKLGMPMELWFNTQYFSTIFTAYSLSKQETEELSQVHITCGTVRNKLTEILNGRL